MNTQIAQVFAFAVSVTAPIFMVVSLGAVLKRFNVINDEFIRVASNLVFNIGLPVMLFISTAKTDFSQLANPKHIAIVVAMTMIIFFGAGLAAWWHVEEKSERGVYVQGAYRGNLVIIGLAFCANAYGELGLAIAALPVAILVTLYNVLAVYILNVTLNHQTGNSPREVFLGILKNPLIIGILTGLAVNLLNLPLPDLLLDTGGYFSRLTLPLALLCIGGAMNLSALRLSSKAALGATTWKLILSPLVVCLIAIPFGIRGPELAVLFLLASAPTAAASFVMVKAMGGNASLAANIIVLSTFASLVTVTGGLSILKYSGLL
ncbi:MAG TPA: AEC family transporter [Gammaproteobacteria bacterium]